MESVIDQILDENEKVAVKRFYDDELTREAVKKVFLASIYHNGVLEKGKKANPLNNFALGLVSHKAELKLTNEELGEHLSRQWEGINFLELGFKRMETLRDELPAKVAKNPAR